MPVEKFEQCLECCSATACDSEVCSNTLGVECVCEKLCWDGEEEYVDSKADEFCSELCYRVSMEEEGFCEGDSCIDWECYSECIVAVS